MLKDTYLLQDEVQSSGSSEDGKSKTRVFGVFSACFRRILDAL